MKETRRNHVDTTRTRSPRDERPPRHRPARRPLRPDVPDRPAARPGRTADGRAVRPARRGDGRRIDHEEAGQPHSGRRVHVLRAVHRPQHHLRRDGKPGPPGGSRGDPELPAAAAGPGPPVRRGPVRQPAALRQPQGGAAQPQAGRIRRRVRPGADGRRRCADRRPAQRREPAAQPDPPGIHQVPQQGRRQSGGRHHHRRQRQQLPG